MKASSTYYGLQFLRFLCAVSVVALHAGEAIQTRISSPWHIGGISARLGVETFFVISGFVMMITNPAIPDRFFDRLTAAYSFLKRRIIRVAPTYWLYSILKIILVAVLPALALRSSLDFQHIVASFLFIPSVSPWGQVQPILPVGWTLNYEFAFYAIFAVAILAPKFNALICTALLLAINFYCAHHATEGGVLEFYGRGLFIDFIIGMLVAHAAINRKFLPPVFASAILLVTAAVCIGVESPPSWFEYFYGALCGAIVFSTISLEERYFHKLNSVTLLGDSSYSIYLTHSFITPASVIFSLKLHPNSLTLAASVAVLLSCVCGVILYVLVERPLTRRLKTKFDGKKKSIFTQ